VAQSKHSIDEFVNGMVHSNPNETFSALLERGYNSLFHRISEKQTSSQCYTTSASSTLMAR